MSNNRISIIFLVAIFAAVLIQAPFSAKAQQILPNPNPKNGTITVSTSGIYNKLNPFSNNGIINITTTGMLTNSATLTSIGTLNNSGTLFNEYGCTLNNWSDGILTNYSWLSNDGTIQNSGILASYSAVNNYGSLVAATYS